MAPKGTLIASVPPGQASPPPASARPVSTLPVESAEQAVQVLSVHRPLEASIAEKFHCSLHELIEDELQPSVQTWKQQGKCTVQVTPEPEDHTPVIEGEESA